jgi:CBS domain-containing protein
MGSTHGSAVALTSDGTSAGRLVSVVTARDLTPAFGDQPAAILRDIHRAGDVKVLRSLNRRARACALQHLTGAASAEWIARFTELADHAILARILSLTGLSDTPDCWCVCGASGRGESIAKREPRVLLIHEDGADNVAALNRYARVIDSLAACEDVQDPDTPSEPSFYAASAGEWSRRYRGWIQNPVVEGMARHRALFDLRPVHGQRALLDGIRTSVAGAIDRDIVQVLAHDCLANLPPLTFFRDAVVDHTGEQTSVFKLEQTALQPLVDLGRVFGMAARDVVGTSTLERFTLARRLLPANEAIFREASETLRIVLWQQGRIGISQGTTGSELPPSLLSRHDRHMLRSGFPVIHRLLEFSSDPSWLDAIS